MAENCKVWICWPTPDGICLQGGCSWCIDGEKHTLAEVRRYAESSGLTVDLDRGISWGTGPGRLVNPR